MKHVFGLILIILINFPIKSQIVSGKIISSANISETVEFVNIGIKGRSFGTVSDERGDFRIDLTGKSDADTVIFSHIGYYPFICTVRDLRNKRENNQFNLTLKAKMMSLDEVVVRNRRTKIRRLGDEPMNTIQGSFFEDKLGCELGTVFRFKGKKGRLKKVSMKIASCTYDSLCFRINIYNVAGGVPDTNILKQPIYYKGPGKYPKGYVLTVNLGEHDIFVDQDFAVTFELIKDLGKGGLNFPLTFLRRNTVSRKTSQDNWYRILGTGIKTEVEIEK